MFGKVFVILLLLVTPGEARKSFLSFLNIQNTEILSFAKAEETVVVRSSYKDKQPSSSYLFVKSDDPTVLQVVNVTKTSLDATDFTIRLMTFPGETNLTIQLWDSQEITWQQNGLFVLKNLSYLTSVLKKTELEFLLI